MLGSSAAGAAAGAGGTRPPGTGGNAAAEREAGATPVGEGRAGKAGRVGKRLVGPAPRLRITGEMGVPRIGNAGMAGASALAGASLVVALAGAALVAASGVSVLV